MWEINSKLKNHFNIFKNFSVKAANNICNERNAGKWNVFSKEIGWNIKLQTNK